MGSQRACVQGRPIPGPKERMKGGTRTHSRGHHSRPKTGISRVHRIHSESAWSDDCGQGEAPVASRWHLAAGYLPPNTSRHGPGRYDSRSYYARGWMVTDHHLQIANPTIINPGARDQACQSRKAFRSTSRASEPLVLARSLSRVPGLMWTKYGFSQRGAGPCPASVC